MVSRTGSRAYLRAVLFVSVIAVCASDSATRAEPSLVETPPVGEPMRLAHAPVTIPIEPSPSPSINAPYGSQQPAIATAPAQAMKAKWQNLQSMMAIEQRIMELCRAQSELCPSTTARFLSIIDEARRETGRARIGAINRAINLAIRPARDAAQFGVPDVWQSPLMTFAMGSGDCEDYAIAKYVALREAGMSASDLKLVLVHDDRINEDHAVTAARIDGEWLILDNRKMLLLTDAQASDLKPLIALGEDAPAVVRDAGLTPEPAING